MTSLNEYITTLENIQKEIVQYRGKGMSIDEYQVIEDAISCGRTVKNMELNVRASVDNTRILLIIDGHEFVYSGVIYHDCAEEMIERALGKDRIK